MVSEKVKFIGGFLGIFVRLNYERFQRVTKNRQCQNHFSLSEGIKTETQILCRWFGFCQNHFSLSASIINLRISERTMRQVNWLF